MSDNTEVYTCTQGNNSATNWLCSECLAQIFPFNHLDDTSFDLVVFENIYGIYIVNYCYLHDAHLNMDGLYGHCGKFKQLLGLLNHEFSVIGISESTWLMTALDLVNIPGYLSDHRVNKTAWWRWPSFIRQI